jgi:hypothetical protein
MEQSIIKQCPSSLRFKDFIFSENKVHALTILILMMLQWAIFKLCYPFPDFFSDSYSYIRAAYLHLDVNIWPIGYSRFLYLFHTLNSSGFLLTSFQYVVYAISALFFYYTITYFYHTGKNTRIFLCLFLFFNPLFLYLANYITSDMLFVSMSIIWLTQLFWVLRRPKSYQILVQALFIFALFTFRYNAMIYPVVAAGIFFMSRQKAWIKIMGMVSGPALIIPFILWQSNAARVMTGTPQFPPILGGWQWGNNALYMRGFIQEDSNAFPTPQTAELDRIARDFFFRQPYRPQDLLFSEVANFFIRHPEAPLKQYMSRHYQPRTNYEDIAAWGKSAVVFDQYGKFLIKRHPLAFAHHYLLVNTKNYFMPPLEKLEVYNLGQDKIGKDAQFWFHYTPKVWCISNELQGNILALFPTFFLILNIYFGMGLLLFIRRGGFSKFSSEVKYTISIMTFFLALNAAFSIFANIIVIRYQIFPMLVLLTFAMLLTDYIEMMYPPPSISFTSHFTASTI